MRLPALVVSVALAACTQSDPYDPPDVVGDCADIYAQDLVPTFELDVAPTDWSAIRTDFAAHRKGTYYPAVFHYGSEVVRDARIKLRGRSDNWIGTKMQLLVAFNRVDSHGRFHGLRKIALDASPWDHSLLRERVALAYLRDAGVPAKCANNARLVVNGEYQGLYTSIEEADKEYLQRIYARPEGDLFGIDGETGEWELKTNEDTSTLERVERYLSRTSLSQIDDMTDLDHSVHEWAREAMLPHTEGYVAGVGNFLLYDHPARGFVTLPHDLDSAFFFGDAAGSNLDRADPMTFHFSDWPRPDQVDVVLDDPAWRETFFAELADAHAAYDDSNVDAWAAQIAAAVAEDSSISFEQHEAAVAEIRAFIEARRAFMTEWLDAR
jgi:spore coat protein CotH